MSAQSEPRRDCLAVDNDGDVWRWNGDEWVCLTQSGQGSWDGLHAFGPFQIFTPQTGDGAADAAQTMGGSLPPAASSSLDEPGPAATIGGQPGPVAPRRFQLYRHTDISHVSGIGVVAWGVQFPDGSVAVRWHGARPSTVAWGSVDDAIAVHGHSGATEVRWIDWASERACRICECTDEAACFGGCYWVAPDLCSQCNQPGGQS